MAQLFCEPELLGARLFRRNRRMNETKIQGYKGYLEQKDQLLEQLKRGWRSALIECPRH